MELTFKTKNPKQLQAAQFWIDSTVEEILYGGAKGGGKLLGDDSTVLTPFGFKKGRDLNVGDMITNPDGSVQKVVRIAARETLPRARVSFSDGTYTDVAPQHLWKAWKSKHTRKVRNKRTSGIDAVEVVETRELKKWVEKGYAPQIEVVSETPFNITSREKDKIEPYLLGVLLGDGCITKKVGVSAHKDDIPHYIEKIGKHDVTIHARGFQFIGERMKYLQKKLLKYGLLGTYSHTKFIPEQYKMGPVEARYELVRGLMDTDGYMPKGKHSAYYYTTSETLANDMAWVLRSLGAVVTVTTKVGKIGTTEHRKCYCLHIKHRKPSMLFSLERKRTDTSERSISKRVDNVLIQGEITGRCIQVSNPNGLYITDDFIVTHNSFLGATLIFGDALIYPGTHYFIARQELNDLVKFTIPTIHEVFRNWGIKLDDYGTYNGQDKAFYLNNGSKVYLIACKEIPSDPLYERFGSMQMTRGWIEEGGEIAEAAKANLWLSIGRWMNDEYGLKKKLLITANPKKGWMKRDFVDPAKEGVLAPSRRYIQAFATDNTYLPQDYVQTLRDEKDMVRRQRLWEGNWDYDDDANSLISFDALTDAFSNTVVKDGQSYMTVDVARLGRDKTVFSLWDGLELYKVHLYEKLGVDRIIQLIKDTAAHHKIPYSHILVDEDGVGGGVVDGLFGVKGFTANSTPVPTASQVRGRFAKAEYFLVPKTTFSNLKAQCGWKLAELINERKIAFYTPELRDTIIEELTSILKDKEPDGEGRKRLIAKDDVKQQLGHSPDLGDTILMRAYFELVKDSTGIDDQTVQRARQEQEILFTRNRHNISANSAE